jgi:ribosome-associated toxin RatA of RatAB toxin-antitoxin module
MRRVQRSALVRHSAAEMFSLVDDVASYPQFLPGCRQATVHVRNGNVLEATLELGRGNLSKTFRTRNTSSAEESIDMQLVDGPFRHLEGRWTFQQLGDSGSKVALDLEFELSNSAVDLLFGPFFEDTCNSLVDAFTQRADKVFAQAQS